MKGEELRKHCYDLAMLYLWNDRVPNSMARDLATSIQVAIDEWNMNHADRIKPLFPDGILK